MHSPTNGAHDTPPLYRPAIRHAGPCGPRRQCWRQACRDRFGPYPTIEVLQSGRTLAYCHRTTIPRGDLLDRRTLP